MCAVSQAEAVSSPCRPLTNRPPVPDGTTLHYAVASTEAKLVFSDREATHAPPIWRSGYFGICGIILGVTKWTVVRFSNGLCFRVSHRANQLETNTKYEHPRQEESEPRLFGPASPSTLGREKRTFSTGRSDTIRRRATRPKARARAPNHLHIPPLPTDSPAVHDARRRDPDATHTVTRSRSHFICDTAVFDAQESSGER